MSKTDTLNTPESTDVFTLPKTPFMESVQDYIASFKRWDLWFYLAYAEIRRRYRRTVIGPFWATLSVAIFIGSMGFLFSKLWHQNMTTYLPFFASGYVVWVCFSTMVTESCQTFIAMDAYMKQIALPYCFYGYLVVCRNMMVFLHQFVIFLAVALIFHVSVNVNTLMAIPGLALFILNFSWISIAFGLLCTRYRDVQQIVTSLLQIAMFVTPIFWSASQLGHSKAAFVLLNFNPIYHMISVVRYPLLGQHASLISWGADIGMLVVGWSLTMWALARNYHKLIYWL